MAPVVVAVLAFLLVAGLVAGAGAIWTRRGGEARLRRLVGKSVQAVHEDEEKIPPNWLPLVRLLRWLGQPFENLRPSRQLERELLRAGFPVRGSEFLVFLGLTTLGLGLILFWIGGGSVPPAALGALVGGLFPRAYVNFSSRRRLNRLEGQIPDVLSTMTSSLKAGYSFLQAMEMVATEMAPPVAEEFARTLKDMNLGMTTEDALENLATRVGSDDLRLVVTAVLIQRQVGGNLSEVLENIATTIRERIRIRGEIQTLTAQGRISGIIISLLPVAVGFLIYMMNPEYMGILFRDPVGWVLLSLGVTGQIMGALVIRKIVNIEV